MIDLMELVIEEKEFRAMQEGYIKAKKEHIEGEITRLITKLNFTDQQIVEFAEVSPKLVRRIRKKHTPQN